MTDADRSLDPPSRRTGRMDHLRRLALGRLEPRAVARGLAVGVFVALSPFIGLQAVLALALAVVFRLDKIATLTGAILNPPWLWPFVYPSAYWLGASLLGRPSAEALPLDAVMHGGFPELVAVLRVHGVPLVLGTTLLGAVAAAITQVVAERWVRAVRSRLETDPREPDAV